MATEIWVNIGSGNGLLPDGTKPLPEPMLTDHQWSPVTFIWGQFHKRCLNHQSLKSVRKLHIIFFIQISQYRDQWVERPGFLVYEYQQTTKWIKPEKGRGDRCRDFHCDGITWNLFQHYWPFVRGSHLDSPHKWPVMSTFVVFFVVSLNKLLSCRWFETPWRSCDVIVMPPKLNLVTIFHLP